MPRVAVDAMGGDHAPEVVVEGALLAAREFGVDVILVGQKDAIERELNRHAANFQHLTIAEPTQNIAIHESASTRLRKKDTYMNKDY
jgi:glycerol-3-phosphate acyltransferase PlsX